MHNASCSVGYVVWRRDEVDAASRNTERWGKRKEGVKTTPYMLDPETHKIE